VNELIKQITDKFDDIDMDKAKEIVGTVVGFIKDKLPGPIGDQVAKLVGDDGGDDGGSSSDDMLGKAKDALGGLLGN
jgi:hypothetical protein